ncbi:MAG: DegV family protein [Anaerolineae bacterium]|jgi:DegV family protein with EDD domain|nr:DegV family protein [Anaerolineae bacterium]MBT7069423.1 DegV family protein [Anaerolineae bacterium]MBT7324504.1 DegV family protein [Anaerolineae bacterium]
MKIRLVTDSTADIPADLLTKHKIEVVPALLIIDGESYADGEGITREEFYARMPTMQAPATTAAPSVGSFMERYEKLLSAGAEKVLSIHAASTLSGIFNAARLAAENFGERVQVFDSKQLSLGCGFQVLSAAEAIAKGTAIGEITHLLENLQKKLKLVAVLDTLEFLRRSGRVSWTKARLGSFLNLKPLIELVDGRVENLGAVRTTRLANIRILEMLREVGNLEELVILHTNAEERARQFLANFTSNLPAPPRVINVTTAIGAHLGPNGVGFAAVRK